jgi:activator of HSP90 ATPase
VTKTVFEQTFLPAAPDELYATYLDSERHSRIIGATVVTTAVEGADFTAFDGHVQGRNLHLVPDRLIVQAWGSDQLGAGHLVVIAFDAVERGTQVSLLHTGIPDDKLPLVDWEGRYWQPWRAALERRSTDKR